MSKAGALAATGIGGGGAAIGGYYVFGRGGGSGEATTSTDKPTEQPAKLSNELIPKTLEEFKQNKDIDCIKNYFGELDYANSAAKSISSTDKIEATHFNDGDGEKSCLVVNWEKTDNSSQDNGKWKGNFRWVWSFSKGSKGFVMFTTTKLTETEKQLDLEGAIYFVKKDNDKWTVEKKKELDASKKIDSSNWDKMFMKAGESITDLAQDQKWGFMTAAADLDKLCKKSEESSCPTNGAQEKTFKGSWTWTKGDEKTETLVKWCENFSNCFSNLYDSSEIALNDALKSLRGTWAKEQITPPSN